MSQSSCQVPATTPLEMTTGEIQPALAADGGAGGPARSCADRPSPGRARRRRTRAAAAPRYLAGRRPARRGPRYASSRGSPSTSTSVSSIAERRDPGTQPANVHAPARQPVAQVVGRRRPVCGEVGADDDRSRVIGLGDARPVAADHVRPGEGHSTSTAGALTEVALEGQRLEQGAPAGAQLLGQVAELAARRRSPRSAPRATAPGRPAHRRTTVRIRSQCRASMPK